MTRLALLLLLLAPVAAAGAYDAPSSAVEDATGWNTQKKITRAEDGARYHAYVETSGNDSAVVVVRKDDARETLPELVAARGGATRPSLTLATDGALHLAWTERADEDREVFAARYVDGAWRDVTQLSGGQGYAGFPSLAAGPDGAVHVAWYGFDGANYQTFVREWRQGAWAPARQLSTGPLDANNPSLVVDGEGAAHVAWYKDEGRRYSIWYARKPHGADWELPQRLPDGGGDALNVALAVGRDGLLHAVWDERDEEGQRIMRNARGADGEWGAPQPIATGRAAGEYPAIAAHGSSVLVAWRDLDGGLRGWDGRGEPRPLLGGAAAVNPSLRGAQAFPAGDRDATLDVLFTRPDGEVHILAFAGCSPFEDADGCPPPPPAGRAIPLAGALVGLLAAAGLRRSGHVR